MFETPDVLTSDYFDNVTITLGEWYEMGFYDPSNEEEWGWNKYNDDQYERVCDKFLNRYWYREVAVLPAFRWKQAYLELFNEIMPKYKLLYRLIDEGRLNILQDEDKYGKSRNIFSDFPATMLSGNSDYASTGTDKEFEEITDGNVLNKLRQFYKHYKDVDVMILDDCEVLFTCLLTSTVPMF